MSPDGEMFRLVVHSSLATGVNVSVNDCLSPYGPVMDLVTTGIGSRPLLEDDYI